MGRIGEIGTRHERDPAYFFLFLRIPSFSVGSLYHFIPH